MVGNVGVGGANPIRVQSMITCDTMDTEASIAQTIELAAVGCEIVRITAPTVKDSRQSGAHRQRVARARLRCADRGRHPFQAGSRDGSGEVGGESPDQSRAITPTRRSSRSSSTRDEQYAAELAAHPGAILRRSFGYARSAASPCASARITARLAIAS